ncbi:MAG TPA: hypothetical protein VGB52_13900 [Actinomycetota bacterium]
MRATVGDIATITGPFVAEAAACGIVAPFRLVGQDAHGWVVAERADTLVLDDFGELWWVRIDGPFAHVVRAPWPEELRALRVEIERSLNTIRARAFHPAGRARR